MTQLGEMVSVAAGLDDWECPFPHNPRKHDRVNVIPDPSTANNAGKLSDNLDEESANNSSVTVKSVPDLLPVSTAASGNKNHLALFVAHHLVPGNESWPTSELYKWVDKRKGHIKGDIGYDVNSAVNGVDLPSSKAAGGWSARSPGFQRKYAFACMACDTRVRQFHDRHPAYSDFVIATLDKVAAKLDARPSRDMGCDDEDCFAGKKKPFAPPYALNGRLASIAGRMRRKLYGDPRRWKQPIMTSRFALMYKKQGLDQKQAREQLRTENFLY
ncbi:MAG: AHH domain-containing protein [Gammaproteobacteria bacterium]